jgi:CHAP domain
VTDWWDTRYKVGPPIDTPGFPRPLYPPDAAGKGKTPSVAGPDVEAAKRIAWRLGRWKGPASGFDRAYSNAFSHGKGPNVIDSGMAGVQRQAGIEPDTGWVGKATFDLWCSVLIPEGCPGPGEPGDYAMDAYTQSLLVQAWDLYGGKEPVPPAPEPTRTLRSLALATGQGQIGVKESPPNSNQTKYTAWYGMTGPWCAMFCTWCYETTGNSPTFRRGQAYAYVPYIVNDARRNQNGLSIPSSPIPGDLVCYDWQGDGVYDHVGLFEAWQGGSQFTAIEGNTSTSNDSNGGQVMRRTRDAKGSVVFCRVAEP